MGFVVEGFFEDGLPGVLVCAYVVECLPVDVEMKGWVWWSIKYGVEVGISSQAMGQKEASYYAVIDYVESSCVVQVCPVCVGFAQAAEEKEFSQV